MDLNRALAESRLATQKATLLFTTQHNRSNVAANGETVER